MRGSSGSVWVCLALSCLPTSAADPAPPAEAKTNSTPSRSSSTTVSIAEELAKVAKEVELLEYKLSMARSYQSQARTLRDNVASIGVAAAPSSVEETFIELKGILERRAASSSTRPRTFQDPAGASQAQPVTVRVVVDGAAQDQPVPPQGPIPQDPAAIARPSTPVQTPPPSPPNCGPSPDRDDPPPKVNPPVDEGAKPGDDGTKELDRRLNRVEASLESLRSDIARAMAPPAPPAPVAAAPVAPQGPAAPQAPAPPVSLDDANAESLTRRLKAELYDAIQSQSGRIQGVANQLTPLETVIPGLANSAATLFIAMPVYAPVAPTVQISAFAGGTSGTTGGDVPISAIAGYFPKVASLIYLVERSGTAGSDSIRAIADARRELDRFKEIMQGHGLQDIKDKVDRANAGIDSAIAKLEGDLTDRRNQKAALSLELKNRDDIISQSTINWLLVFAVYGMVVAIVVLFYILQRFPEDLARRVIDQRVLIEVLSMGFLLLTVIILGTGKLLNSEGLAALLGTIAGYIFARKAAEIASALGGSSPDRATASETPSARTTQPVSNGHRSQAAAAAGHATSRVRQAASVANGPAPAPPPGSSITIEASPSGDGAGVVTAPPVPSKEDRRVRRANRPRNPRNGGEETGPESTPPDAN